MKLPRGEPAILALILVNTIFLISLILIVLLSMNIRFKERADRLELLRMLNQCVLMEKK